VASEASNNVEVGQLAVNMRSEDKLLVGCKSNTRTTEEIFKLGYQQPWRLGAAL